MTRILLVESETQSGRGVAGTLRDDGFDVLDFRDGRDLFQRVRAALGAGEEATPTAVVADVSSGAPCCGQMLRAVRDSDLPVPVILAAPPADRDGRAAAYRLGADAVVDRPLDPDQVLAALELVLMHRAD
ncbi:MAG: response regulator transcription factor [Deltaproteobacteria bacterium]|nr:response regulator transcription factor [Deltaproteobacteria bacterium]